MITKFTQCGLRLHVHFQLSGLFYYDENMEKLHQSLRSQSWSSTLLQHNGFQRSLDLSLSSLQFTKRDKIDHILNLTLECDFKTYTSRTHDQSNVVVHRKFNLIIKIWNKTNSGSSLRAVEIFH
jgi:hypothetical protein